MKTVAEITAAWAAGRLTDEEAEALCTPLSRGAQNRTAEPRRHVGARPRKPEHVERRRRWAAAGKMPPRIASGFTTAEQAVLAAVAAEVQRKGDCRLSSQEIADRAGVSATTVKNALREARAQRLIASEERRLTRWRNDTNIVRIISPEWGSWLRLGGGGKSAASSDTSLSNRALPLGRRIDFRYKKRAAEVFAPPRTALTTPMSEIDGGYQIE